MSLASPTLDDVLGGALPGRIHLVCGPTGAGKSAAALHFLATGLARREPCALVTTDHLTDVVGLATRIGVDLARSLRARALTVLRYRTHFGARVLDSGAPRDIVDELRRELGLRDQPGAERLAPLRLVVDSISPWLANDATSCRAVATLAEWLEEVGATALLTWRGDVRRDQDRRLDPLVDRAAVVAHMESIAASTFRVELVRARHAIAATPPLIFEIVDGAGIIGSEVFDSPPSATLPDLLAAEAAAVRDRGGHPS